MENSSEVLSIIRTIAVSYLSDARVMLFGSRARNDHAPDSDFDILIVTNQELTPKEKMPLRTRIRKDLLHRGIRSDVLIQNTKEIVRKQLLPGHIIKHIMNEAIAL